MKYILKFKFFILLSVSFFAISSTITSLNGQENTNVSTDELMTKEQLLKRGQRMFLRCRTCHTINEGGKHGTGPNLYGIFGSKSASKEGFTYSKALQNSNIVWSEETINTWMSKPRDFVKGTTMAFVGLRKPKDREALIAYLKENTK